MVRFAEAVQLQDKHTADRKRSSLSALVTRRRQLIDVIKAEGYRLNRVEDAIVRRRLRAHLTWLKHEQALVERAVVGNRQASDMVQVGRAAHECAGRRQGRGLDIDR
jgi:hypothetical protein